MPTDAPVLHQLVEVFLHVLEHKVQRIVLPDHLLQLHNVRVTQLLQRLEQEGEVNSTGRVRQSVCSQAVNNTGRGRQSVCSQADASRTSERSYRIFRVYSAARDMRAITQDPQIWAVE